MRKHHMQVPIVSVVVVMLEVVRVPVLLVVVVVRYAGAVISKAVGISTVDMRVDVLIAVSNVTVGLLLRNALTDIAHIVLISINIGVLVYVNVNVFTGVMTSFDFAIPPGRLGSRC